MLQYVDDVNSGLEKTEALKQALLSSGNYSFEDIYPQPVVQNQKIDLNDPNATYDFTEVEWESPSVSDMEEFERFQQELANTMVQVSTEDFDGGEWN